MYKRKLLALGYFDIDKFDIQDEYRFRQLISWLEDQKIRHYKIEDRAALRTVDDPKWNAAFEQYLKDLGLDNESTEKNVILDTILNLAVRLEYEDNADQYNKANAESIKKSLAEPQIVAKNQIDNLDFDSDEFKEGVSQLAKLLKVPQHPDHLVTLKAIAVLVTSKLRQVKDQQPQVRRKSSQNRTTLESVVLGFDLGDVVLNRAAKVLRILFINDLRELQTKINEVIVACQSITANPKTDSALGKVGR